MKLLCCEQQQQQQQRQEVSTTQLLPGFLMSLNCYCALEAVLMVTERSAGVLAGWRAEALLL